MIDKEQVFEPRVSATKLPNGKMVSSPLGGNVTTIAKKRFLEKNDYSYCKKFKL